MYSSETLALNVIEAMNPWHLMPEVLALVPIEKEYPIHFFDLLMEVLFADTVSAFHKSQNGFTLFENKILDLETADLHTDTHVDSYT